MSYEKQRYTDETIDNYRQRRSKEALALEKERLELFGELELLHAAVGDLCRKAQDLPHGRS